MALGKRLKAAYAAVDTTKPYPLDEAIRLIKANAKAKFDETVEMSLNLGIDPRPWISAFSLSAGKAALRNLAYSLSEAFRADGVAVATVTIAGRIQEGTPFAPDLIADTCWRLHLDGVSAGPEVMFTGG